MFSIIAFFFFGESRTHCMDMQDSILLESNVGTHINLNGSARVQDHNVFHHQFFFSWESRTRRMDMPRLSVCFREQ